MELNLRLVEVLIAVAEEGSMSRAAGRLHLSQQAVSSQIAQLERAVGDQLLARTSRGVALTPAGAVVLDRGRALLRTADQMATEVRAVTDGRAGRLRVAFKAQSTAHFMPRVVAALETRAPDVRIDMTSVSTLGEEIELLTGGEVDAAFLWLPTGDERLDSEVVVTEPRVVAVHPDHPLADREGVALADLSDDPVVGPHATVPREVSRFWADDPRPGGTAPYGPEARTPEECLQLVAAARGVWMAPASVVDYFALPRLVWMPVTDGTPFALAVAWARGRRSNLLDVLVTQARRLAAGSDAAGSDAPPP